MGITKNYVGGTTKDKQQLQQQLLNPLSYRVHYFLFWETEKCIFLYLITCLVCKYLFSDDLKILENKNWAYGKSNSLTLDLTPNDFNLNFFS